MKCPKKLFTFSWVAISISWWKLPKRDCELNEVMDPEKGAPENWKKRKEQILICKNVGAVTFSRTTLTITTLNLLIKNATLSIFDTQRNNTESLSCITICLGSHLYIVMLSVVMVSAFILNVLAPKRPVILQHRTSFT